MGNRTESPLDRIGIASPCPQSWEQMRGDDACRFCQLCEKNVYNFAAMTGDEILRLIREKEGRVCGRLYRRADGTLLTADCPVGRRHGRIRLRRLVGRCAAAVLLTGCFLVGGTALARSSSDKRDGSFGSWMRTTYQAVERWIGLADEPEIDVTPVRLLLGRICLPDLPPTPNPAPPAAE